MTRLEKIVLEQTRKSKPGTVGQTVSTDAVNQKAKQLKAISFLLYYVFGKKQSPINKRQVASVLPKISIYGDNSIYSRGEYFYVIGEDYKENEGTNKAVIYYPIYIIRQSESDIESLNKFMIGGTTIAPIIDINDFQNIQDTIKKKKADAEAAAIAAAEKKKPAIEITKVVVQNVVNGTETINVNNLGKGTPDADAFQELMWQAGNKLNFTDEPAKTDFKNFAYYRTKGLDGGWDGDIGDATLDALYQFVSVNDENLYDMWAAGKKAEVIEELRLTAAATVSESINYFKGKGMNVKLKDLLQEQLLKEQAKKAPGGTRRGGSSGAGGGGGGNAGGGTMNTTNTTNTTNTKKKTSSTNFTQATFPSKYNGSGTITYNNGDKFTGSWENGLKSGKGKYTIAATKTTIDGYWEDGKKISGRKIIDIDVFYKESVASTQKILSKMVNYINNHKTFVGYKDTFGDDEEAALIDLVKPYFQANIQPEVYKYYTKYIKPYMSQFDVSDAALTVEYDLKYVGTNNSVTNISNTKFRKIFQNYLVLKANSSNTALNHPTVSAAYYNYAGDKSSFTIPAMFYYNYARSVHYWSLAGGRAVFNVDTDF